MGYTRAEMETKIDDILAFADIGEFIHQPVKTYSSGMFARLAFSVAINVEPDILIVDEALSVGDANFQLKCLNRMNELRISGVTILFVSHDTYSVKALCNRALFIKNGVMQAYGTSIDVVHLYQLYLDEQSETKMNGIEIVEVSKSITPVKITKINSSHENNKEILLSIFDSLEINIEYDVKSDELDEVVFVFNLYRERDNLYVCGATTLMDNIPPIKCKKGKNKFSIKFNELPLLSGKYRLRIAINEKNGLSFMDEINDALFFIFNDNHESEGLIALNRTWHY
jgi:energy-coupling factor transporter ATP-binding protein EcfA2